MSEQGLALAAERLKSGIIERAGDRVFRHHNPTQTTADVIHCKAAGGALSVVILSGNQTVLAAFWSPKFKNPFNVTYHNEFTYPKNAKEWEDKTMECISRIFGR
jgi:hypothetical protein